MPQALFVTHVHLDHAGGAGLLMRELPLARLLVHPRGARHMIDPQTLFAGAAAVYGISEMARSSPPICAPMMVISFRPPGAAAKNEVVVSTPAT